MHDPDTFDPLDLAIYATVHGYTNPRSGKKGAVGLAPVVGMPVSTLQNKANPAETFARLTVTEARSLMLVTGDHRIGHQLMADVGEACIPLPTFEFASDLALLETWAEWQAEIGETALALKDALEDGRVTQAEVARVRRELTEDFVKGLGMLDVLSGMAEPEEGQ